MSSPKVLELFRRKLGEDQKKKKKKKKKKVFAEIWGVFLLEFRWRQKKVFAVICSVFSSESLFQQNLVLYSTGFCRSFTSDYPALKSRVGDT